jgi:hypothetical protein
MQTYQIIGFDASGSFGLAREDGHLASFPTRWRAESWAEGKYAAFQVVPALSTQAARDRLDARHAVALAQLHLAVADALARLRRAEGVPG